MGQSGSGKSTLLSVASMRVNHHLNLEGSIWCDERPVSSIEGMHEISQKVGFVPQSLDLALDMRLTTAENLYFQTRMRWSALMENDAATDYDDEDAKVDKMTKLVKEILDQFELFEVAHTKVQELSGGSKRRLAIAIECLRPSPIMFLDEPTTGQDAETALEIVQLLRMLSRGGKTIPSKTVVLVIHQPRPEIFELIDDIVLLTIGGRVVYNGSTRLMPAALGLDPSRSNMADAAIDRIVEMDPAERREKATQHRKKVGEAIERASEFEANGATRSDVVLK